MKHVFFKIKPFEDMSEIKNGEKSPDDILFSLYDMCSVETMCLPEEVFIMSNGNKTNIATTIKSTWFPIKSIIFGDLDKEYEIIPLKWEQSQ